MESSDKPVKFLDMECAFLSFKQIVFEGRK